MQIKSIVAGAAIALVATVGSASAVDQFTTMEGVGAQPMTAQEMAVTRGSGANLIIAFPADSSTMPGDELVNMPIGGGFSSDGGLGVAGDKAGSEFHGEGLVTIGISMTIP